MDIVERLLACRGIQSDDPDCCCEEAAAEIKRLRAALRAIRDDPEIGVNAALYAKTALSGSATPEPS